MENKTTKTIHSENTDFKKSATAATIIFLAFLGYNFYVCYFMPLPEGTKEIVQKLNYRIFNFTSTTSFIFIFFMSIIQKDIKNKILTFLIMSTIYSMTVGLINL